MELKLMPYSLVTILVILLRGGNAVITIATTPATVSTPENTAVGTTLATLAASGGTSTYTYEIVGTSNDFQIVTNTDELLVKAGADLNFEAGTTRMVTIIAKDSATPQATGTLSLTVTLTDVNENPTFASATGYSLTISNNATANTVAGIVAATDVDAGTNGQIASYTITSGNTDTTFTVSTDGEIKVASGKTANALPYILEYVAADSGSPALSGTTTVLIVPNTCHSGAQGIVGFGVVLMSLLFHVVKYI